MNPAEPLVNPNQDLLDKLRVNKESAFKFRRRRHGDWTTNYLLYRDKVMYNRLTQRQSVNIPLIKSSIQTLLKDVDDPPILYFANLDNNDQAEVYYNAYWDYVSKRNDLILKDIMDKLQVMLYGRSYKFLNIIDGDFTHEVVDPQDVLIDRYVDPSDIDSARFLIREHLYVPLASLKTNPIFDNAAVSRLQDFLGSEAGLIKADQNQLDWVEKMKREAGLGVIDAFNPILGETYVELNYFFIKEFNETLGEDELKIIITAEDMEVLYSNTLEGHIGETNDHFWRNHYPATSWGNQTERTDWYSDGVADSLRTPNQILNTMFSQMIENRILKNFNMTWFNSSLTDEGFLPQTFDPIPGGWYPIPVPEGQKMGDVLMPVAVGDLQDNIGEMNFILQIAQQASAATTFQQGVQPEGQQITLGEVQILLTQAQEKVKAMAVYYTAAWEDFGLKYTKMLDAGDDLIGETVIHKKGRLTKKNYSKTITPKMWFSKQGYKVEVIMKQDMEAKTGDDLQKLQYAKSLMPTNKKLDTVIKTKALEFADINATEMSEILKEDEQQTALMANMQNNGMTPQPGQPTAPGQPAPMQPPTPQIPGQLGAPA